MSLVDSYDLVDRAEKLATQHRFKEAAQLYKEASRNFQRLSKEVDNGEIQAALRILAEQHLKRGEELRVVDRNRPRLAPQQQPQQPTSPLSGSPQQRVRYGQSSISSSLANARAGAAPSLSNTVNLSDTAILDGSAGGDPVTRFQIQVYNLVRAPNLSTGQDATAQTKPLKPTGKSVEELELENATLKQLLGTYSENLQTYESFHKKVKQSMKSYLSTLKRELQVQEQEKKQEYDLKIEQLYKDNKRLEQQTTKLKQRWNELVESAKKRREDQSRGANSSDT